MVKTHFQRWLFANRYTWLLGTVILLAALCVLGLGVGIRTIQNALPVETLHKQRDFSALLLDIIRLEHAVELLASEPKPEEVDEAQFALDVAANRAGDNRSLYSATDTDLAGFHQDLSATLKGLESMVTGLSAGSSHLREATVLLAASIEQLHALHQRAQQINDTVFQHSVVQVSLQRERLEELRVVLVLAVVAIASAAFLLVMSLLRQKQAYLRLQTLGEEIRNFAFYDHLTGLANRRLLIERVGHAMHNSQRSTAHGAVLFIDLDHFKTLNDTEGHDTGDKLLVQVAGRLLAQVRSADTVARLGGDEFVVMLENLGSTADEAAQGAERVAEAIRQALNRPFELNERRVNHFTSPSIGIALFAGAHESVEMLLKQADVALYQAKDAGRNTTRFFSPTMQARIDYRSGVEVALRAALDENQFVLHFQPLVTSAGQWVGAEALIRWNHLERGLLLPGEFIEIAEDSGLIVPIGAHVVELACAQLRRWADLPGLRDVVLSVNVSAKQFRQADFVDQIQSALTSHGVRADRLKLELTETAVLHHVGDTQAKMQSLRNMGVEFALDDFGTGYSSLIYLKQLPFGQVKIDRSFVSDIGHDHGDEAICSAVISLAHKLGLQVVAEGVETVDQQRFLTVGNACDLLQGYLFGKPSAMAAFERDYAVAHA